MTTVQDILRFMESIAPAALAEDWDNSGLQCGDRRWKVERICVALDPTPQVVRAACDRQADLLITHHPLVFRPLKNLDLGTPLGEIIAAAVAHRLAVFSVHTNLDAVSGGLNDYFAEKIGLANLSVLEGMPDDGVVKCVVYAPENAFEEILRGLMEAGAGVLGNYTGCTFRNSGIGTFTPGPGSHPHIGVPGRPESVAECRVETWVRKSRLTELVDLLRERHPYETMAFDVYPLHSLDVRHGIGRVGELPAPMDLRAFGDLLKTVFEIGTLKIAGPPDLEVRKIAVCTGSGSGLMKAFFASGADVFVSGDLKYHDAQNALLRHKALIDAGHFASEKIVVPLLVHRLEAFIREHGLGIAVEPMEVESDPFYYS